MSDASIDEHANHDLPSLVVFGPNSCGKTSFIQRFLIIGNILPTGIGAVTARIVKFSYAPGQQARCCVYETIEKRRIIAQEILSQFFEDASEPNWEGVGGAISPHVQRPSGIDENSEEFHKWAMCFVEILIPSDILFLGVNIYDTPGFLSDNREQVLTENLHELVKRIKPTLLFLYDNATISDTEKSCFLAMKSALGSMERVPVFFLNTKADCISIANDYYLDEDPENVTPDVFISTLHEKRQKCYEILLQRREMESELLGGLPDSFDECTCFDICTFPGDYDPWETYTNMINSSSFLRIIQFLVESYSKQTRTLARDMRGTIDDYFDLIVSTTLRTPNQWKNLCEEAEKWGIKFFDEYEKVIPLLANDLIDNISLVLGEVQNQIICQASMKIRRDDPIGNLLTNKSKGIQDYIRLAFREQVIKVAANKVIIKRRDEVKNIIQDHFDSRHGLRKNELLAIAQRQVLSEISTETLQHVGLIDSLLENMMKISVPIRRFWLSLPSRLSSYCQHIYNAFIHKRVMDGHKDVYNLLDAMDAYATLSNEDDRRDFAKLCLAKIENTIKAKKERFQSNLAAWVQQQKNDFFHNIALNYEHIQMHRTQMQSLHNLISKFSGPFAKLECRLWSALELETRGGIRPVIGEEIGRGGFYSVHAAQWGTQYNLVVKKLLHPTAENSDMAALEAHYHRVVTLLYSNNIVPLLHIYENTLDAGRRELWLIMPRFSMSLRQYLMRYIHDISLTRALSIAVIIAKVLAELHRLEIVHRDIKSTNIMLGDNEQCYVIDFGTAKFGLLDKTIIGTAPLPPEMTALNFEAEENTYRYDGAAADIYSFGLLLYEMLPKSSYDRLGLNGIINLEESLRFIADSNMNIYEYKNIIRDCLDEDPAKRPSAADVHFKLHIIQQRAEAKPCMMCEERDRTLRFNPCGHKVTCAQCWEVWRATSNEANQCILCKAIVSNYEQDNTNATFYLP